MSTDRGLWLDFNTADGFQTGATVDVDITERSPQGIAGSISVAGGWLESVVLGDTEFARLSLPGSGYTSVVGEPQLPRVRTLLAVPAGVELTAEITGQPRLITLADVSVDRPLAPQQAPVAKLQGELETAPLQLTEAAYQIDAFAPAQGVRLVEAGYESSQRLVMLEVAPIAYNPVAQAISVYDKLSFDVRFQSGEATATELSGGRTAEKAEDDRTPANAGGRLLVIVHDDFADNMAPYVAHKTSLGWEVDVADTSTAGLSTAAIRSYIQSRYDDVATRPDAVLLVGDTDRIPYFTGLGSQRPPTDLYYTTMDDGDDWYPEFPVGRFSVADGAQLDDLIAKTISYEASPSDAWTSQATFMAGRDNYHITEGTHDYVIDHYLEPAGYTSDELYEVTHGASTQDVRDAFNAGTFLGVYSGHGSAYGWADGPPLTQADVRNLSNMGMYPFVFSFACITGSYHLSESFMETWLRQPDSAAVAAIGSSVNSYWTEDDILEKVLFSAIYEEGHWAVGNAWLRAKELYLEHFGTGAMTRSYFEMYNLLGDPTLEVFRQQPKSSVSGRHVFYNNSAFDGNASEAGTQDDNAIAPDKEALLPGQTATFANYTSYDRGINGIMVDIDGLPQAAVPGVDDFEFRVGNDSTPDGWIVAPSPHSISVRRGEGVDGSDRITILWADNAIEQQWLMVTVLPTVTTGLSEPHTFYFGNAIGETGNSTTDAKVNAIDILGARDNQRSFLNPAPIDFNSDFDRNARVDATDMLIARNNPTHFLNALQLITVPGGKASSQDTALVLPSESKSTRGSANLDWLYEFHPANAEDQRSREDKSIEGMTDRLLATTGV